jgi:uncharacterized membrane protein SpoIIM required for sporulation
MTPLAFEHQYQDEWFELEQLIAWAGNRRTTSSVTIENASGARLAALYRRACEQLALSRARSYPAYIVDRLDRLTTDAHQLIYSSRDSGVSQITGLLLRDLPRSVRAHGAYIGTAAAVFFLPTLIVGLLVYMQPELILSVVDSETAASFEEMYSPTAESIGRERTASTDWMMFGFYVRNNISVAFQCFAGGLFAGFGSLFFLAYNGAFGGAVAGFLTARGLSSTFYSFVATHAAFELTAIVLAGAAGLRMGHALLAPGRSTRLHALIQATRHSIVLVYGATALLFIAAVIEAFWSSANWLLPSIKYSVAAVCWAAVLGYFLFQGRHAD